MIDSIIIIHFIDDETDVTNIFNFYQIDGDYFHYSKNVSLRFTFHNHMFTSNGEMRLLIKQTKNSFR